MNIPVNSMYPLSTIVVRRVQADARKGARDFDVLADTQRAADELRCEVEVTFNGRVFSAVPGEERPLRLATEYA